MGQAMTFEVRGRGAIRVEPDSLLFAAFTSRDPAVAEHHRLALKEEGDVVPDRIPICYPSVSANLLQDATIDAGRRMVACEAEFVRLETLSGVLVTAGVDLYNAEIEHTDIGRSKIVCATPIAKGHGCSLMSCRPGTHSTSSCDATGASCRGEASQA